MTDSDLARDSHDSYFLAAIRARANREPDFIVGSREAPYLRRWWIIPRNRFFNIYLHQFLRSDDDRALHDHPWPNLSILLRGTYVECRLKAGGVETRRTRKTGAIVPRLPWTAHRIEIEEDTTCWTLFLTGPVMRLWGFHCRNGWRPWHEFVDARDTGSIGRGCE